MKTAIGMLEQQTAFAQNIELLREVIFGLRYSDITNYTGLAESSMISYDSKGVSPYLSVAKKIADLYCVSIERLCGSEINFDMLEVLDLQVKFILRMGGIPTRLYKEKAIQEIEKHITISKYDVYKLLSLLFKQMVGELHRFNKFVVIAKDEQIIKNFTDNFRNLMAETKVGYRKLVKATDVSLGNLTRLSQGAEPMLSAVIKFADFFEISITELLSEKPHFDYAKIKQCVANKMEMRNTRPPITQDKIKEQNEQKVEQLTKEQALEFVDCWLNKVNL